jgi:hypothetical protein
MIDIKKKLAEIKRFDLKTQREIMIQTLNSVKDLSKVFEYLLHTFAVFEEPNAKLIKVSETILITTFANIEKGQQEISEEHFHQIQEKIKEIKKREEEDNAQEEPISFT